MTTSNTVHGNRSMSDRRLSVQEHIAYYLQQAKLARLGLTTRRSEDFYLRQVEYFRSHP